VVLELDLLVLWLCNVQEFVLAVIMFARNRKNHVFTSTSSFKLRDYTTNDVAPSPRASRLSWFSSFQFPISIFHFLNTEFRIQHRVLALVTRG
jgi:hypothetical protein